tara:strand:+ start:3556 stop:3756 length:201 start_codon:yes stop_codon:yes gene_type:complete
MMHYKSFERLLVARVGLSIARQLELAELMQQEAALRERTGDGGGDGGASLRRQAMHGQSGRLVARP